MMPEKISLTMCTAFVKGPLRQALQSRAVVVVVIKGYAEKIFDNRKFLFIAGLGEDSNQERQFGKGK